MNELTIPARLDEQHGYNVFSYDQIIVASGAGPGVKCVALGWQRNSNGTIEIKTNKLNFPFVPLHPYCAVSEHEGSPAKMVLGFRKKQAQPPATSKNWFFGLQSS